MCLDTRLEQRSTIGAVLGDHWSTANAAGNSNAVLYGAHCVAGSTKACSMSGACIHTAPRGAWRSQLRVAHPQPGTATKIYTSLQQQSEKHTPAAWWVVRGKGHGQLRIRSCQLQQTADKIRCLHLRHALTCADNPPERAECGGRTACSRRAGREQCVSQHAHTHTLLCSLSTATTAATHCLRCNYQNDKRDRRLANVQAASHS